MEFLLYHLDLVSNFEVKYVSEKISLSIVIIITLITFLFFYLYQHIEEEYYHLNCCLVDKERVSGIIETVF